MSTNGFPSAFGCTEHHTLPFGLHRIQTPVKRTISSFSSGLHRTLIFCALQIAMKGSHGQRACQQTQPSCRCILKAHVIHAHSVCLHRQVLYLGKCSPWDWECLAVSTGTALVSADKTLHTESEGQGFGVYRKECSLAEALSRTEHSTKFKMLKQATLGFLYRAAFLKLWVRDQVSGASHRTCNKNRVIESADT